MSPDADRLFRQWRPLMWKLARRWYFWCVPFERASVGIEDLLQEFARVAAQRFHRWRPERVTFPVWFAGVVHSHARYLRQRALRFKRAAVAVSQYAGDDFDRFAEAADPRQLQPWEILAADE